MARYHRRAKLSERHSEYAQLKRRQKQTVRTLAAMLRLAESLDRSHAQMISGLDPHDRGPDALM